MDLLIALVILGNLLCGINIVLIVPTMGDDWDGLCIGSMLFSLVVHIASLGFVFYLLQYLPK